MSRGDQNSSTYSKSAITSVYEMIELLKGESVIKILSLLIATAGVIIAWWSIQNNWWVAEKSGSFEEPDPVAFIAKKELGTQPRTLIYGKNWPESTRVVGYLPIAVRNKGKESAEGVTVTFRFPTAAELAVKERYGTYESFGRVQEEKIQRRYGGDRELESVSYSIPDLNPGELFTMAEEIYLSETDGRRVMAVPKRYRKRVSDSAFAVRAVISLSSDNSTVQDYPIEIICLNVSSMKEFNLESTSIVGKKAQNFKDSLDIFEKAGYLFSSLPEVSAITFYAEPDFKRKGCKSIYIDTDSYDEYYWLKIYPKIWFRYPNERELLKEGKDDSGRFPAPSF